MDPSQQLCTLDRCQEGVQTEEETEEIELSEDEEDLLEIDDNIQYPVPARDELSSSSSSSSSESEEEEDVMLQFKSKVSGVAVVLNKDILVRQSKWKKRIRKKASVTKPLISKGKDIVNSALRQCLQLQSSGLVKFSNNQESRETRELRAFVPPEYQLTVQFNKGWAKRPAMGATYGAKWIGPYREDIVKIFNEGARDKSNKKGPAEIIEALTNKYPNVYTIPNDAEVRAEISKLLLQSRKQIAAAAVEEARQSTATSSRTAPRKRPADSEQTQDGPVPKTKKNDPVHDFFLELLTTNLNEKPRNAIRAYKERFPDCSTLTDQQLTSKFSGLKGKVKSNPAGYGIQANLSLQGKTNSNNKGTNQDFKKKLVELPSI